MTYLVWPQLYLDERDDRAEPEAEYTLQDLAICHAARIGGWVQTLDSDGFPVKP